MNHILYTKNFQAKTIGLLFVLIFFISCSPTVYILDHKPKFAGQLYRKNIVNKTQNKINNSRDNLSLLKNGVEEKLDPDVLLEVKSGQIKCIIKTSYFDFSNQLKNINLALKNYHFSVKIK